MHWPGSAAARTRTAGALITEVQFNAGEKLAADFWHAQLSPKVTASWSAMAPVHRLRRATPGLGVDMRDAVVAARQRFQRALEAVGPELAGILVDVCCHDMGLEASGHASGWPQRAAKVVLDLALTRLARHYGLLAPERPAAARLRHWGDADYRPTLDGLALALGAPVPRWRARVRRCGCARPWRRSRSSAAG